MNISIEKPKSVNHVLNKTWSADYGIGFKSTIDVYANFIDTNRKLKKLTNKLFLKHEDLSTQQINQYIQAAVEMTVVRYFAENFPEHFKLEPKLIDGSDNDVECQFKFNDLLFNIEVKATSYIDKIKRNPEDFSLEFKGHLDNYEELHTTLKTFLPNLNLAKRFDNNLKSHLYSAQSKFPVTDNNKFCNVLIIGCNDSEDIQKHYDYLHSPHGGFFTKQSFIDNRKFDLVDIVFLTNIFFKHNYEIENPKLDEDSWKFEKSFIVGFRNPFRKNRKEKHLDLIETIVPNYTKSFKEYTGGPEFIRLRHFIHTELGMNRKIYHY